MSMKHNAHHNIRAIRQRKKISQEKLAEKTGLSLSYISELERGNRQPSLDALDKIAKGLGVPAQRLLADLPLPTP